MVLASVGPAAAEGLGLGRLLARDEEARLDFGKLEPLVDLMQTTAPDRILQVSVDRLRQGAALRDLIAAAALANVRTFGGEDYVGFHTMMAMAPAYHMAGEERSTHQALPVLKVLLRNSKRIHEKGGEVLRVVSFRESTPAGALAIRDAVRGRNMKVSERIFAASGRKSPEDALNELLLTVEDDTEVHRIVMVYRSWDLLDLVGKEQAHTILRQSSRSIAPIAEATSSTGGHIRVKMPREPSNQNRLMSFSAKRNRPSAPTISHMPPRPSSATDCSEVRPHLCSICFGDTP
jgi:hypothetical protein